MLGALLFTNFKKEKSDDKGLNDKNRSDS